MFQKGRIQLIILILLLIIFAILFFATNIKTIILKAVYPKTFSEDIEKYSKENNLDPLLIYAVVKTESNFNEEAVSKSGAVGAMQLLTETAKEVGLSMGNLDDIDADYLKQANHNIELGTKYFSTLVKRYNNNISLALIAYNAGIGNTQKWIEQGILKEDGSNVENIPFKETSMYVRKILREYEIYKKIYS